MLIKLALCELVVCVIVVLAYVGLNKFNWTVITGAALGFVVALLYFIFLIISTSRAVDNVMERRGNEELSEEEVQKFVDENKKALQTRMHFSFYLRIGIILAALIVAFLTQWFAVFATIIPLLCVSPILMLLQYFGKGEK